MFYFLCFTDNEWGDRKRKGVFIIINNNNSNLIAQGDLELFLSSLEHVNKHVILGNSEG